VSARRPPAFPPPGRRVDELHRPPTRFEKFRAWIEGLSKIRLYAVLVVVTWASLTALIGFDSNFLAAMGIGEGDRGYQVGDVAREDVYSPRGVTYQDTLATQEARQTAADNAPEVYRENERVPEQAISNVRSFFEEVRRIRDSGVSREEKVSRVAEAAPFDLSRETARDLVFLDDEQVNDVERYTAENLRELYATTSVADDSVDQVPASILRLSEGRNRLSEAARRDASGDVGEAVDLLSRGFLEPDYVIDREATQKAREEAASKVAPVEGSIRQGELVVARGEVIGRGDIDRLEALSGVRDSNPWTFFLGVGLVVAVEMGIAWYFLERFGRRILKSNAAIKIVLAVALTILFTALARAFMLLQFNTYLIPLAGLSILGTILLGPRLMFLMVVVTSVNVGIIGGNDFLLTAALLLSSGFAIYTAVRVRSRQQLLRAGLFIAGVMGVVTFAVSLIGGADFGIAFWQGVRGLGNGLLSLGLTMVLLPLLEDAFNILTPMKLLELSDPGNELLQKLLRVAPGTFSHSMQVGNMAETAAERIGADPLLARVAAYYHDIGKVEHPAYFIENQISAMNPHAALTPALSAKVIKRHIKDGVEIGRAWNLPQEILDIVAEHHGTTRIEYFYRKALEEALPGEPVRESDFRYSLGRPHSKESGILMIADSVEATVKSLAKPTPKRVEDIVEKTIRQRIEDGQLDDCQLTMHEIHAVGEAVRESLIGFLGPRIEYPETPKEEIRRPAGKAAKPS
jgi:putative nucleotidyltransferase with HDIG domain